MRRGLSHGDDQDQSYQLCKLMSDYLIHGKKGNGKSLVAVGRMRDALLAGKKVATNLDLKLEHLLPPWSQDVTCYRLPDRPTVKDMEAIGKGSELVDESSYGVIVLDEMATWMNARSWGDKERQKLLDWFVHSRKLGWDVYFICQSPDQIDKQARTALLELSVACKRLDKIRIPFLGVLTKNLLGFEIKLPQIHVATVRYGMERDALVSDRWTYRGRDLYKGYDTRQVFRENYSDGLYSYLSPWHFKGRYMEKCPRRLRDVIKGWFAPRVVVRMPPKAKHPLVQLLARLPVEQRVRHFNRLSALGAF